MCCRRIGRSDLAGGTNPFNEEYFFIIDLAVGSNWLANPDTATYFPPKDAHGLYKTVSIDGKYMLYLSLKLCGLIFLRKKRCQILFGTIIEIIGAL